MRENAVLLHEAFEQLARLPRGFGVFLLEESERRGGSDIHRHHGRHRDADGEAFDVAVEILRHQERGLERRTHHRVGFGGHEDRFHGDGLLRFGRGNGSPRGVRPMMRRDVRPIKNACAAHAARVVRAAGGRLPQATKNAPRRSVMHHHRNDTAEATKVGLASLMRPDEAASDMSVVE